MSLQARYTILRKIADGGTAEIFLATQNGVHGFEKVVVLKRIFPSYYADPQFRNMLVNEAHIAMSFNHSNIVQVLDLGEDDGQYILALELVDGWTLDAVIRRVRAARTAIPPALALYITAEVCRALAYAHAKTDADGKPLGIVHRDISPHNVLLSEQGEVKLTDFGIATAKNLGDPSGEKIIKGKIAYMSPEQAAASPLDARSDLFSVGTLLYVTVCGRYPFDAPTDLEVLLLVKNGEAVPPEVARPGIHPEISRILKRAMAKDPAARYQRADDMLLEVEQVMRAAFRAVGQTELKRWLQDLSTRDGIPPLTKAPALPSSTPAGRVVGAAPQPASGATKIPSPPTASRSGSTIGRPPPPPAAWSVTRRTEQIPAEGPGSPLGRQGRSEGLPPAAPVHQARGQGAPAPEAPSPTEDTPPPSPPSPAVPTRMPAAGSSPESGPLSRAARVSSPSSPRATQPPRSTASTMPGAVRPPLPPAPVIPRPPVSPEILATLATDSSPAKAHPDGLPSPQGPQAPSAPALAKENGSPSTARRRRLALLGVGLGGLLVVFASIRTCSSRQPERDPSVAQSAAGAEPRPASAPSRDASDEQRVAPIALPPIARTPDAASAETSAAMTGGDGGGSARPNGALAPLAAGEAAGGRDAVPEAAPLPNVSAEAAHEILAGDGAVGTTAIPSTRPTEDASAHNETGLAGAASPRASAEPPNDESGRDQSDAGEGTTDASVASNPRVTVMVKSVPPGAQVATAHHNYGTTPTSIRLRPGNGYALTFTREGFRPLSKHIEVTTDPDQEINVTLHKAPPPPPPKPVAAPAPAASPPRPPPPAKPAGSWWQKMFKR